MNYKNEIIKFSSQLLKSEVAKVNANLFKDYQMILDGNCIYIPSFFCKQEDYNLLQKLAIELCNNNEDGMIKWSKHLRHDNPTFSKTFNEIISKMADYFDVEIYHTRLNFYKDNSDWKPLHHDSHAYGNKAKREDFTMGASFGFERELLIKHDDSGEEVRFPQKNGDIFAFTNIVNQKFMHGIPKCYKSNVGPRFSIIAWGRRKTLNEKNGGNLVTRELYEKNNILKNKILVEDKNILDDEKNMLDDEKNMLDDKNMLVPNYIDKEVSISNKEVLEIINKLNNSRKISTKKRKGNRLLNRYMNPK